MNNLILVLVALGLLFLIFALIKRKATESDDSGAGYAYQKNDYLLSKAERSFFGVLQQAAADNYLVFAKVRVADVLAPMNTKDRSTWQKAFNAISAKHFDFILCEPGDCSIQFAVELDDASHNTKKAQKRDGFLNEACNSAGLELIRVKASNSYSISEIRALFTTDTAPARIEPSFDIKPEASAAAESEVPNLGSATSDSMTDVDGAIEAPASPGTNDMPSCPKCGEAMVRRKAKSGKNSGVEFWGCSTYPKCRGMMKL